MSSNWGRRGALVPTTAVTDSVKVTHTWIDLFHCKIHFAGLSIFTCWPIGAQLTARWSACAQFNAYEHLKYEKNRRSFSITTYLHFKFHCKNLISRFVTHNQIQYILRDIQPKHHPGHCNTRKPYVTWRSRTMQLLWGEICNRIPHWARGLFENFAMTRALIALLYDKMPIVNISWETNRE